MIVKYKDIKREVRNNRKLEYGIGVVLDVILWISACAEFARKTSSRIMVTVLCLGVFVWLTINYFSTGKKLKKMWENIGSPDTDEINRILSRATSLDGVNILILMTPEYLLDFQELKAYPLTDITKLYKSSISDEHGKISSYIAGITCKNCPFEKDELCFNDMNSRDAALTMIAQAYYAAGGKEMLIEAK